MFTNIRCKKYLNIIDESFQILIIFFYNQERVGLAFKEHNCQIGPIESYIDVDKDILLFDNISETNDIFCS